MDELRELTMEEVRDKFLDQVWVLIDYWYSLKDRTVRDRMEGVVFSVLSTLDGGSSLPKFIVAPDPHQDDKEYNQEQGESWYPLNDVDIKVDIAGGLHEHFYKARNDV